MGIRRSLFAGLFSLTALSALQAEARPLAMHYSLPLKPEYADVATFDLPDASWRDSGASTVVTYRVPEDLMGRDDEVMVMITSQPVPEGDFFRLICHRTASEAYCTKRGDSVACAIKFKNLDIDPVQVEQKLIAKYGRSELTDQRIRAAHAFGSDAVGTISIVLPQ